MDNFKAIYVNSAAASFYATEAETGTYFPLQCGNFHLYGTYNVDTVAGFEEFNADSQDLKDRFSGLLLSL